MKKRLPVLLLLLALLTGCAAPADTGADEVRQYQATFLDLFDTVTTVLGYASSEAEFSQTVGALHDELLHYHQLFDIYNEYEGVTNLKTLNDAAGSGPVEVGEELMALLLDCRDYYDLTAGRVNVFFGSVLQLWHDARLQAINYPDSAALPKQEALASAALHADPRSVILDEAAGTVTITDPALRLDVGAAAKGWAVQRVAEKAPAGLLLSVGGNVCATGPKPSGQNWVVGVQSPEEGSGYLHTLNIPRGAVVTSGDYQRYFFLNGKRYHHIIDPDTLQPGTFWRAVTVVCGDSGLADCLSTALFLMDLQQGQALLERVHAEAMWIDEAGERYYSPGFRDLIRN